MFFRKVAHAICVIAAGIPWFIGYVGFVLAAGLVVLADKTLPDYPVGNCWSYVGPRWIKRKGYMSIRPVSDAFFLKVFPIPHVAWVHEIHKETKIEQTIPLKRHKASWFPWRSFYFPYKVIKREPTTKYNAINE